MEFDIIDITKEELEKLTVVAYKMLRTAQQKKDELVRKSEEELKTFKRIILTNGMKNSSLLDAKNEEIQTELKREVALLADNLLYNMSLNEPSNDGDIGGDGGDEGSGYIVDYSLPYNQRYAIVRDYYFAIADPQERMALYIADEVAKRYLDRYYGTLYDVLYSYRK